MKLDSSTLKEYAPIAARYVATATVGAVVVALNHYKIQLDPTTTNSLTVGLTGVFVVLITFAFRNKASDKQALIDNTVHAAVTGEVAATVAAKATPEQLAAIQASPVASVAAPIVPAKPAV